MHGTADLMADPAATVELVELAGSDDATLELVPEGFHALLHDLGREATLDTILAWIEQRIPPAAETRPARPVGGVASCVMGAAEIRTVTDVERLTPDQRQQLVNERTSTDLSDVPDDFVERARADGRRLLVERGVIDEG